MSKVLYIAGPMSRIPQFNFPLFEAVAVALRADGLAIVSPHECDSDETRKAAWESPDGVTTGPGTESWGECLARDVKMLADGIDVEESDAELTARRLALPSAEPGDAPVLLTRMLTRTQIDGIALLPNWEKSRGARLEAFVGLLTGKEFYTVRHWPDDEDGPAEAALHSVDPTWVQHMLALDWVDGIRMHKPL